MTGDYALYRWFDASDQVLYIGKSANIAKRTAAHIRSSQWMQFAVRSTIERHDTPQALRQAERFAIESEHPIFNREYNETPEAVKRAVAYLEEVGRADLLPGEKELARLRSRAATGPFGWIDVGDGAPLPVYGPGPRSRPRSQKSRPSAPGTA